MKRKLVILVAFLFLIVDIYVYMNSTKEKEEILPPKKIDQNMAIIENLNHLYKYVSIKKDANLYKKNNDEYKPIGKIKKDSYLILTSKINNIDNIYLNVENTDYYVKIFDIKKTDKLENSIPSNYVVKYKLTTKNGAKIQSFNTDITLDEKINIEVIMKDNNYYFIFNGRLFYINSENVLKKIDTNNEVATSIPVLNYHFFYNEEYGNYCNQTICLSKGKLEEQLKYLRDNDFTTLTMQEFIDWHEGKIELPEKSVLLTIDDGGMGTSLSDGNILIPLLEKYQVHATLFLITAWWDKEDYKSDYLEIESHGYDIHRQGDCGDKRLACLSEEELKSDLSTSIYLLESNKAFCYPFYRYTSESIEVLKQLEFKTAFVGGFRNATRGDDSYLIPRYPIYDSITLDEFKNMVK